MCRGGVSEVFKLFFAEFADNFPHEILRENPPNPLLKGLNPLINPSKKT